MKKLTSGEFFFQAYGAFQRYSEDNPWFGWQQPGDKFDLTAPVTYIFAGYAAYEKVCANPLGMLILGDNKLRTNEDLVSNFGLSSARGVQPPVKGRDQSNEEYAKELAELQKFIDDVTNKRVQQASPEPVVPAPAWNPNAKVTKVIPVIGAGSILSTAKWSPLLNDSFIMAGVHQEQKFYLGLSGSDTGTYEKLAAQTADARELWKKFFNASPDLLWNDTVNGKVGVPRVLLRELIGLKTFGYKPQFDKRQLGFLGWDDGKSDGATIGGYLDVLKENGFDTFKKEKLFKLLGTYLFEDADALKA